MAELDPLRELLEAKDKSYKNIRSILFRYNLRVKNANLPIYDQNNQSGLANFRSLLGGLFSSGNETSEYLGIVLNVVRNNTFPLLTKIYVDVPGVDAESEEVSPDAASLPGAAVINRLKQRIFYPIDIQHTATQAVNHKIVRVRLASNYLNNATNTQDNKYLGLFLENLQVEPATDIGSADTGGKIKIRKDNSKNELVSIDTKTKEQLPDKGVEVFDLPFRGNFELSSVIGFRNIKKGTKYHYALDIAAPIGTPVLAPALSRVEFAGYEGDCGNKIKLRYPSDTSKPIKYYFIYCHLSEIYRPIKPGQEINPGGEIGRSGNTGGVSAHIHFEIQNAEGERLRPQFILTGAIKVRKDIQETYGYPPTLNMPFPVATSPAEEVEETDSKAALEVSEEEAAKSPPIKADSPSGEAEDGKDATAKSNPVARPKMRIVRFNTDYPKSIKDPRLFNWQEVKVREDIYDDLAQIKGILNNFGIPLACEYVDAKIDNKNATPFGKVGLEVRLNSKAGLQKDSNHKYDDYFVGPNYSIKVGNGYKLKIYGRCTLISSVIGGKYSPIFDPVDVYSVKETINIREPQIIKVQFPLIDISKIFEDFGFINVGARANFFKFSNIDVCYWNIWYKPAYLKKGTSYRELLETVYGANSSGAWNTSTLVWDGERFI